MGRNGNCSYWRWFWTDSDVDCIWLTCIVPFSKEVAKPSLRQSSGSAGILPSWRAVDFWVVLGAHAGPLAALGHSHLPQSALSVFLRCYIFRGAIYIQGLVIYIISISSKALYLQKPSLRLPASTCQGHHRKAEAVLKEEAAKEWERS